MTRGSGERQRWIWLAAGLSAAVASKGCGYDWVWVLIGGGTVTAYYSYLDQKLAGNGLAEVLYEPLGKGGCILAALTLLWMVLVLGWTAGLAALAFPSVKGFPGMAWILLALTAWAAEKGPAVCARCSGVLCLFLIVLYSVIIGFAIPDLSWSELKPTAAWDGGIWTAGLFLLPAGVWFLPCDRPQKGPVRFVAAALPLFAAALAAVTAGVLSAPLTAARPVPLYDVAQSVSLFGVVERIEPLLSAAMTMGVFALLSSMVSAAKVMADRIRPWDHSVKALCAAAAVSMYLTKDMPVELIAVGELVFWGLIPMTTLLAGRIRSGRT